MPMERYDLLLFVVDFAIVLHSVGRFFMSLVCTARVYIRSRIRNMQSKSRIAAVSKKWNGLQDNALIHVQQMNVIGFLETNSYLNFAYNALLAFAVASYICFATLLKELLVLLTKLHWFIKRYLVLWGLNAKCNNLHELHGKAKRLMDLSNKKLPQNITFIMPNLNNVNKLKNIEDSLEMSLNLCKFLQINSVTLYSPFAIHNKVARAIVKVAEKYSTVSCVFSVAESESIFLEALSTVKSDESFEASDVTKRIHGYHADMVMVCGGLPSLYGYIPWHTKLSEIFFLPDLELLLVEDIEKAFTSFLSIEQRFGK